MFQNKRGFRSGVGALKSGREEQERQQPEKISHPLYEKTAVREREREKERERGLWACNKILSIYIITKIINLTTKY